MGPRANEFVSDDVRTSWHRDRGTHLGAGVANAGSSLTFTVAAVFALMVLAFRFRFSINFASEVRVEPAPVDPLHDFPSHPEDDDGPITVTVEYSIPNEKRQRFQILMQEVQAAFRRNGASIAGSTSVWSGPASSGWNLSCRPGLNIFVKICAHSR